MKIYSLAAGLAVLASQVVALFDDVEQLDSDNFQNKVVDDEDNLWMVAFYADWCPYCKPFSSEFANAKNDPALVDRKVRFGAVDVMANRDLTTQYGIKRSPTVKVFGRDKSAPVDYTGHRKQADVVSYCDNYCLENDYVIVHEPKYEYNIDAIVNTIVQAHEQRVAEAEQSHQETLYNLQAGFPETIASIKADFDQRLQALIQERRETLQGAQDEVQQQIDSTKSAHVEYIASLDDEAIQTIESIIESHKNEVDLTDYIQSLGKDWFQVVWDYSNRRELSGE
jgi:thiol-disulfide isomerase/thioredoxin